MGKTNNAVNTLLERKDIFADFINGTVFSGEQILSPEKLELLSTNSGFCYEEDDQRKLVERHGDIRMQAGIGTYSIIILEETQDSVHYGMPVRKMLYEALEYMKQLKELEKKHSEQNDKLKGDEFLSKFKRKDRLLPVITVVFYCKSNKEWDGSKSLYDMLALDEDIPGFNKIKSLIPDYQLNVIEVDNIVNVDSFRTNLQHIFAMLKLNKNKKELYQYTQVHREEMKSMDYIEKQAAFVLLGEQKRIEKTLVDLSDKEKEEIEVCQAIDELIKDGENRGHEFGMRVLILDSIENQCEEETILQKLIRHYKLSVEEAKACYRKYSVEAGN